MKEKNAESVIAAMLIVAEPDWKRPSSNNQEIRVKAHMIQAQAGGTMKQESHKLPSDASKGDQEL